MIDVALSADRPFLPHAAVVLRSLLLASPDASRVRAHLLHGPEMAGADLDLLAAMVSDLGATLTGHTIAGERLNDLPSSARFALPTWYRTFLPELLPDAGRVLYVDCDTVVFDDVVPLVGIDLDGCALAAVDNVSLGSAEDAARVGLDAGVRYFNAGVLVLDLETWRREDLSSQVRKVGRTGPPARFLDQDALNQVMAHRRLPLHPRWNCQNSVIYLPEADDVFGPGEAAEARRNPGIVHFEGYQQNKPWHYLSKHPYKGSYLEHRSHTPWPDVAIEGRTPLNRILRPLPRRVVGRVLRVQQRRRARRWAQAQASGAQR